MATAEENMSKVVDEWVDLAQRAVNDYFDEMGRVVDKLRDDPLDLTWINGMLTMGQIAVNGYTNGLTKLRSFAVAAKGLDPAVAEEQNDE